MVGVYLLNHAIEKLLHMVRCSTKIYTRCVSALMVVKSVNVVPFNYAEEIIDEICEWGMRMIFCA